MVLKQLAAPASQSPDRFEGSDKTGTLDSTHFDRSGSQLVVAGKSYRVTTLHRPAVNDSLLVLLEPQAERQATSQQLALMPLLTGLTTLVLVGAVAFATSRRLVRRIADMQEQVHGIETGRIQQIEMNGPRDELSSLAESVNRMADELRSMWRTIRETERSRLLSQVAGGLAHQLRNALTGIHLAVQLHRRDCPSAHQESLAVAETELARTAEYIQQLLRSAAGKSQAVHPGALGAVLDEVQSLLMTIAAHRRIALRWLRDPGSESISLHDRDLLRSALVNLVLNALDAAGPDGDVMVSILKSDARTLIRISDSGSGPSPELSDNLFDPFVSSKPEGLGVGLTVVRSAASALGGEVRWYRAGDRTVFEFALPQGLADSAD
jgi:signal transduction histidine kinase